MSASFIYEIAKANSQVKALLGGKPRFYGFGEAPPQVTKPYAVWQLVGGFPENLLAGAPNEDTFTVQIDAYADSDVKSREVGIALRTALELSGYVTGYNFEGREPETRLYRFSFTMEFMASREVGS